MLRSRDIDITLCRRSQLVDRPQGRSLQCRDCSAKQSAAIFIAALKFCPNSPSCHLDNNQISKEALSTLFTRPRTMMPDRNSTSVNGSIGSRRKWSVPALLALKPATHAHLSYRRYLDHVLTQAGPFTESDWTPGEDTINSLESSRVLLVPLQVNVRNYH